VDVKEAREINAVAADLKQRLKKLQVDTMKTTAHSIVTVVHNKATAEGKSAEEKLDDIIRFCESALKNQG